MAGRFSRIMVTVRHTVRKAAGGQGSHSSFERDFIRSAVRGKDVPGLERIEALRGKLLHSREMLYIRDHGAGSRVAVGEMRSVRQVVRNTAVPPRKGRLLARIAAYFDFPVVIELGTGSGISSLYLGMACPHSKVLSCEGSLSLARLAGSNIRELDLSNIEVHHALFVDWLPGVLRRVRGEVLVFIDGDHREESLLGYSSMILGAGFRKTVLVIDDIYWSPGMYRAWKRLSGPEASGCGLEFFNTGIFLSGFEF